MRQEYKIVAGVVLSGLLIVAGSMYMEGRKHGANKMAETCDGMSENKFAQGMILMMAPRVLQVAFDNSDAPYFVKLGVLHGAESKLADCIN